MRTDIEIDDALIRDAMQASGLRTKRAAVEEGLRMMIRLKRQREVRGLFGQVPWEGDLDESRAGPRAAGMIVVDSSVWIDFLNGSATPEVDRLSTLLGTEPLLVGDVILLEVLQGVRSETDAVRVEAALRTFDVAPMLDPDLAVIAATHYRRLRALGITVRRTIDLIIGTFCIARGHALLTAR